MNKSLVRQIALARGTITQEKVACKRSVFSSTMSNLKGYSPRAILTIFGLRVLWKTIENGLSMFGALELQIWLARNTDENGMLLNDANTQPIKDEAQEETRFPDLWSVLFPRDAHVRTTIRNNSGEEEKRLPTARPN